MAGIFGVVNLDAEAGADINVWTAAAEGKLDLVKQAIESLHGNNSNVADDNGYTPLMAAASYGHLDICTWLLANSALVSASDGEGDTALHYCNNVECARALLAAGASKGQFNTEDKTALEKLEEDLDEAREEFVNGNGEEPLDLANVVDLLQGGTGEAPAFPFVFTTTEQEPEDVDAVEAGLGALPENGEDEDENMDVEG